MLNVLRPAMTRLFTPVGKALARTPITPNAITVIGTVGVVGGAQPGAEVTGEVGVAG